MEHDTYDIDPTRSLIGQHLLYGDRYGRPMQVEALEGPSIRVRPPSYRNPDGEWGVELTVQAVGHTVAKTGQVIPSSVARKTLPFELVPEVDRSLLASQLADKRRRRQEEHERTMAELDQRIQVATTGGLAPEVEAELIAECRERMQARLRERQSRV